MKVSVGKGADPDLLTALASGVRAGVGATSSKLGLGGAPAPSSCWPHFEPSAVSTQMEAQTEVQPRKPREKRGQLQRNPNPSGILTLTTHPSLGSHSRAQASPWRQPALASFERCNNSLYTFSSVPRTGQKPPVYWLDFPCTAQRWKGMCGAHACLPSKLPHRWLFGVYGWFPRPAIPT